MHEDAGVLDLREGNGAVYSHEMYSLRRTPLYGFVLKIASEALRGDREVVLAAIRYDGQV